jgi:hypothetical protein
MEDVKTGGSDVYSLGKKFMHAVGAFALGAGTTLAISRDKFERLRIN